MTGPLGLANDLLDPGKLLDTMRLAVGKCLQHGRARDIAEAVKVGEIFVFATAQVVAKGQPHAIVVATHDIHAKSLAHGEKIDVLVSNVDDGTGDQSVGLRAVIQRLIFGSRTQEDSPLRQIGLEQLLQHDSARVLPLLQG